MEKIIAGLKDFQQKVYPNHQDTFNALAETQSPEVLFITCADSRIDPHLITQSGPGDIFVCRNAGNIVPPHSDAAEGMTASIEYAVTVLNVKHIVVCGHSQCGAMKAAMAPESVSALPDVKSWINHSRAATAAVEHKHNCLQDEHLDEVTKANALLQLQHLRTHPAVFSKLQSNELELHAWVYNIQTGAVESFDEKTEQFVTL